VTAAAPQGGRGRATYRRDAPIGREQRGCRTAEREQGTRQAPTGKLDPRQPINKLTIPPAGAAPIFDPAPASALLATAPRPGPAPAPAPPRRPASADAPLPPLHVTRTDGGKGLLPPVAFGD